MKKRILSGVAWIGLALGAWAQHAEDTLPVLSTEELVLRFYDVQNVAAAEIHEVASGILGRDIYLRERGGRHAHPIPNIRRLGDSLVVYDLPANVDRILEACKKIDRAPSAGEALETFEFRPKHVSLEAVERAIRSCRLAQVSVVQERSLVILKDLPDRVREARRILERVDVAEKEIRLRCYLLRDRGEDQEPGELPGELVANLSRLVPHFRPRLVGFALLQTTVNPESSLKVGLGDVGVRTYQLSFRPKAYDEESGALSVERCSLTESTRVNGSEPIERQVFSTNLVFKGGEYTVLGASGSEPLFVVLRLEEVE